MRFPAILRHSSDQASSSFLQLRREKGETVSAFRVALQVLLSEDLASDLRGAIRSIHRFQRVQERAPSLGEHREITSYELMDRALEPPWSRPRKLRLSIGRALTQADRWPVRGASRRWNHARPGPDPPVRAELTGHFWEDILRHQNLIARDLSPWLARTGGRDGREPVTGPRVECIHVVQGETLSLGVVQAMVVARTRALARQPGMPRFRILFLEPWGTSRSTAVREALAAHRALWPEGRLDLVPYVSRMGDGGVAAALALHLGPWRLRRSKPIFHARGPRAAWSAHRARRLLGGGRVVLDLRGHGPFEALHRAGFPTPEGADARALASYEESLSSERRAAAVADHVLAVTEGLRRHAVEDLGVPEERTGVIPNCVEGPSWSEAARAAARARWGNPTGPVLLYSGRIGRERTPDRMFEVMAALLRRETGARFVVLTYLDQVGDWEGILSRHGIPREAVILGSEDRDGALALLPGADAGFVFLERASRFDECASPIKFAEYLSAGLPVLALDTVGPVVRDIQEGRLGWVLPWEAGKGSAEEVAVSVLRSFRKDREALRERALAWCRERYTWEAHLSAARRAYGISN